MDDGNITSMKASRKLLLGELVEVRQKEIGLRGSWHPAKVVRVKYGRRVVEYDDLLTPDHSKKLQESVYLCNDKEPLSTPSRLKNSPKTTLEKNSIKAKPEARGFIRPRPPSCPTPTPQHWKRGLLVDAFYNGAWWEGILVDDVHVCHADTKVKVFFPEEGDELRVLITDIRVSQEWDEVSGFWGMRGYWSVYSETESIDLSSLKEICTTHRSFLKKLWRQKRFSYSHILPVEEHEELQLSSTFVSHAQLNSGAGDGGNACQTREKFSCKDTTLQQARANVGFGSHIEKKTGGVPVPVDTRAEEKLSTGSGCILEIYQHKADEWPKNTKDFTPEKSRGSSRITRSISNLVEHGWSKVQLPRSCDTHEISKGALEVSKVPQQEKLLPASSGDKLPKHSSRANESSYRNDEHANPQCDSLSPSKQESRYNGVFTDCSIPHKIRIRQARLAAKEFLLNAGWRLDVRSRARGHLTKQEVVYISPSGSRFFSLAAACRGWKSCTSHDKSMDRGFNKEIELLSAYCMAGDLSSLQRLSNEQGRSEWMSTSACLQEGKGSDPLFLVDSKVAGLLKGASEIDDRNSLETSSFTSIQFSNCGRGDIRVKKKKSSQNAENKKKRKSEVLGGLSPSEAGSKRSRLPLKRGGCRMQVLLSLPEKSKDLGILKNAGELCQFKKSTVLSWLIDKGILKENEPVSYINRKDGHVMKKGQVTREGVICDCCKEVFTLSNFEAHAGSKLHRPSANTFLEDGRSISDCQLEACAFQDAKEKESVMEINDDTCGVCGDGGELVLCDHCPSTFHADCIGLEVIPEGDWYCPRCCCGICGSSQLSAHDIDNTMHRCEQCELEYHLICAQGCTVLAAPGSKVLTWFCDRTCKEIFAALRALVGVSNPMENGFSWTLLRSMKKDHGLSRSSLLEMAEHHSKLSVAYGVMQECFVPMIDPRTNINLLSQAIYNRRSKVTRLNYAGFYTLLLERGDEIISVATIRVHGARLAEMPLVGTRYQYRRQGMCRRLIYALEEMLRSIGVKKLILPAVPELLDTWMGAFSFIKISPEETRELSKLSLMTFPGTTLLQKYLPAVTQAKTYTCLPHFSDKGGSFESAPCKSVESFLTLARASLDCGAIDGGRTFLTTALDGSGQSCPQKFSVFDSTTKLDNSCLLVDPRTPVTFEASKGCTHLPATGGKIKNRFKNRDWLDSSGDCSTTNKVQKDDDIYTTVVIATTRSNRLVKSRRWVVDGLKELKDAKQSKRAFSMPESSLEPGVDLGCSKLLETLVQSDFCQEGQNVETFYVRTRRKTPTPVEFTEVSQTENGQQRDWSCSSVVDTFQSDFQETNNLQLGVLQSRSSLGEHINRIPADEHANSTDSTNGDEFSWGSEYALNDSCVDWRALNLQVNDEIPLCAKFYSRRKKRECLHTDFTSDFSEKVTGQSSAEEQSVCALDEGSLQTLGTSIPPCKNISGGLDLLLNEVTS